MFRTTSSRRLRLVSLEERTVPATWIDPTGGGFADANNWSGGVPGSNGDARFNLPDSGVVTFNGVSRNLSHIAVNRIGESLNAITGIVVFDLGGATVNTDSLLVGASAESEGTSTAAGRGSLWLENGTFQTSAALVGLGRTTPVPGGSTYGGSYGEVIVGAGATWDATGVFNLGVSANSFGFLTVAAGGTVEAALIRLGLSYEGSLTGGLIKVTGNGSVLEANALAISDLTGYPTGVASSVLTVAAGGSIHVAGTIDLFGATAQMTVAEGGYLQANSIEALNPSQGTNDYPTLELTGGTLRVRNMRTTNIDIQRGSTLIIDSGEVGVFQLNGTLPTSQVVLGTHIQLENEGRFYVTRATLLNSGSVPAVLSGSGRVAGVVELPAHSVSASNLQVVQPGRNDFLDMGLLQVGGLEMMKGTLDLEIAGQSPGIDQDQLEVNGQVILGSEAVLDLNFQYTYAPTSGTTLTLVKNDGTDPVSGTFVGRPEGQTISVNGIVMRLSYAGGDGNDITLTVLNQQPTIGALSVTPGAISDAGTETVLLTATNVYAIDGRINDVTFYRDANGNGTLETATDFRLGSGSGSGNGNYTWNGTLTGVAPGTYTLFAQARRYTFSDVYFSTPVNTTITVTASPPEEEIAIKVGSETTVVTTTTPYDLFPIKMTRDAAGNTYAFYNRIAGITVQRYDAAMSPQGSPQLIVSAPADDVAMFANGQFVVVWQENNYVYARRHNADGTTASGVITVSTMGGPFYDGARNSTRVAVDASGGFAVVWGEGQYMMENSYFRRFSATNVPQSTTPWELSTNSDRDGGPALTIAPDGTAIIVWSSTGYQQIFGRTIDANGNWGTTFYVSQSGDYLQGDSLGISMTTNSNGETVVVWPGTNGHVKFRRFDAQFLPKEAAPVTLSTVAGGKWPEVTSTATGQFVVLWNHVARDPGDGEFDLGVYGQVVGAQGSRWGGNFRVPTTLTSTQYMKGLVSDSDLDFTALWAQFDPNVGAFGSYTSLRYQRFSVDLPPVVQPLAEQTVGANARRTVTLPANDPDGSPINVTHINGVALAVGGTLDLPSGARVKRTTANTLAYEPHGNVAIGTLDSFVYTASDGTKSVPSSLSFRITADLSATVANVNNGAVAVAFTERPANTPALQWTVRGVGADGILGTADDTNPSVTPTWDGATLVFPGLAEGLYRVTIADTLADEIGRLLDGNNDGMAGGVFIADIAARPHTAALDTTFAGTGQQTLDVTSGDDEGRQVVVQPDGKIVLSGITAETGGRNFTLTRLNPDGSLDYTFGVSGVATMNYMGLDDEVYDLALQPDGGIVVVGSVRIPSSPHYYHLAVARFTSEGQIDYSFSDDGWATFTGHPSIRAFIAYGVAVQPDGKIVVSGNGYTPDLSDDAFVTLRLESNGTLDPTFGNGGAVFSAGYGQVADVEVQPNGKILVYGTRNNAYVVLRYHADGSPDLGFGTNGTASISNSMYASHVSANVNATRLALQPDGRIVLFGGVDVYSESWGTITRLREDGALDPTFGDGGIVIAEPYQNAYLYLMDGAVQADGKLLAVGATSPPGNTFATVFRYLPDGTPDTSFGTNGLLNVSSAGAATIPYGLAFTPDQRLVVSGMRYGSQMAFFVGRVNIQPSVALHGATGFAFDIDTTGPGAGRLYGTGMDALATLNINGSDFTPSSSAIGSANDGHTIITGTQTVNQLAIRREITVPPTGNTSFARTIDVFGNTSGAPRSATVRYVSNLSGTTTPTIFATSDGDTLLEPTDWWVATDDADGTGQPAIVHVLGGPRGEKPASVALVGDSLTWTYNLNVANGTTARLLTMAIPATTRAQALAALNSLITPTGFGGAGAEYLTPAELSSLANTVFLQVPTTTTPIANIEAAEDGTLPTLALRSHFADVEDGAAGLTYTLVAGTELVTGTVDPTTDVLTMVPKPNATGSMMVTVRATDSDGLFAEQSFEVTLLPVPDAPAVAVGQLFMLPSVAKNATNPPGLSVNTLLRNASNPDGSAAAFGVALTATSSAAGRWEYTMNAGGLWAPLPALSDATAFLLPRTALVRYVPAKNQTGNVGLQFRVWDGLAGTAGGTFNVTTEPMSFSVNEVGWIPVGLKTPVFDTQGRVLTKDIAEDAAGKNIVAKTLLGLLANEFPAKTKLGLAIVGTTGEGTWQVKVGKLWEAIVDPSDTLARLLKSTDQLRFVPAPNWSGAATIQYRAWLMPTLTPLPTLGDVTADPTSYSVETLSAVANVLPVNDPPTIDTRIARIFTTASQDVANLLDGTADVDGEPTGIAITKASVKNGTWEYRLNSSAAWTPLPKVSSKAALLLNPTAEVRFVPLAGAPSGGGSFEYKIIDDSTTFISGTQKPATSNAFSTLIETATTSFGNTAPTFNSGSTATLTSAVLGRKGQSLAALVSGMTDTKGFLRGLAITNGSGQGTWEYTIDGGRTWRTLPTLGGQRLLLRSTDRIRFTPTSGFVGTASITFAAWDRTLGTAGDLMPGANDSQSVATLTASITV